jgi:8-oxo-dGTP pyrophosphatase MutT (NUDIX family)
MDLTEEFISSRLHSSLEASASSDGYAELPGPIDPASLRCAAVLVPLFRAEGEWHVLFTRRTERVESHKGQVSFPGGACDPGETTPEQTALRETEEEIGLSPNRVHILGRMPQMVTVTRFRITPVVGVISWPAVFRVEGAEVGRIFSMPLAWLADRDNFWEFHRPGVALPVIVYHPFDGEILWGATARMTVDFLKIIG